MADLLFELSKTFEVPENLVEAALALDKGYIPSRCSDAHPSGTPSERFTRSESAALVQHAEAILAFGKGLLSQMDAR